MRQSWVEARGDTFQQLYYETYDVYGNIKSVTNFATGSSEEFVYDNLHRLTANTPYYNNTALTATTYGYDAVGNFRYKSDYSKSTNTAYLYGNKDRNAGGNAGPNAVRSVEKRSSGGTVDFTYDLKGNMLSGDGVTAKYYASVKPYSITSGSGSGAITSQFRYGSDGARYKQISGGKTTYYINKMYEVEGNDWRAYISDVAVIKFNSADSNKQIRFLHRDRLGSAINLTDENGVVKEQRRFDPFGKPRAIYNGTLNPPALLSFGGEVDLTNRGFTDHEHLDDHQLIHMNGRVYDYNLGRFMSVDPFIQGVGNSQGINPYSYVMNNPLAFTDPTGYNTEENEEVKKEESSNENYVLPTPGTGTRVGKTNTSGARSTGSPADARAALKRAQKAATNNGKKEGPDNQSNTETTKLNSQESNNGDVSPIQRIPYGDGQTFVIDPNNQTATLIDSGGNIVSSTNRDDPNYAGNQMAENLIMAGLSALIPRLTKVLNMRGSPKGLIGREFEDWLTKRYGGNGGVMIGGRDFDGGVGNTLWEAKSGQYWDMIMTKPKLLEKFKSDMGARLRIAQENQKIYQLHSNTPIPKQVQTWLDKKGISYFEHLD